MVCDGEDEDFIKSKRRPDGNWKAGGGRNRRGHGKDWETQSGTNISITTQKRGGRAKYIDDNWPITTTARVTER